MGTVSIPRHVRHSGATGKTLAPTIPTGTRVLVCSGWTGKVLAVRKRKKFAKRYYVGDGTVAYWMPRDDFTVIGAKEVD